MSHKRVSNQNTYTGCHNLFVLIPECKLTQPKLLAHLIDQRSVDIYQPLSTIYFTADMLRTDSGARVNFTF